MRPKICFTLHSNDDEARLRDVPDKSSSCDAMDAAAGPSDRAN